MKAKPLKQAAQLAIFGAELKTILNMKHELCILAKKINWDKFEKDFDGYFTSSCGKPAIPARIVVGMLFLKYTYNESDECVVEKWKENPYWQYFCGMRYFQHHLPMHPTSLVKWRKRIGEEGCEKLLKELIELARRESLIEEKDLEKVTLDTTVQEKAITHPTDSKLGLFV
jgi:IS5 family transposase